MRGAIGSLTDRIPAACPPLAVLFVLLLAPVLAWGQGGPTADDEWRITITPYVWTPSVSGSVATQSTQPSAEVDSSSLLEAVEFFALLSGEARRGRFLLLGEANYFDLEHDRARIGNLTTLSEEIGLKVFETSLSGGYRVVQSPRLDLDLFGGLRYWRIDASVSYGLAGPGGAITTRRFERTMSWLDPIVGGRVTIPLGKSFSVGALADIGGFGLGSELQWEALAKVGYSIDETWGVSAGYRHVHADFSDDGFLYDATLSGPFLALHISF